jgi:hypothetical protein
MKKQAYKIDTEEIALKAENGENIENYFSAGELKPPLKPTIKRVNVDFTVFQLRTLDEYVNSLNISRQAGIKTLLEEALSIHRKIHV